MEFLHCTQVSETFWLCSNTDIMDPGKEPCPRKKIQIKFSILKYLLNLVKRGIAMIAITLYARLAIPQLYFSYVVRFDSQAKSCLHIWVCR